MKITRQNFDFVRDLVTRESAIQLGEDKAYLVETRLAPLARASDQTLDEYIAAARLSRDPRMRYPIVDALTTNETSFFRDLHPFNALRKSVLPGLIENGRPRRRLSIWSAACSTGQEPYSIAMLLHEHFSEVLSWDLKITATDLSETALEKARTATYSRLEINRGIPARTLVNWFEQDGVRYRLSNTIKSMVSFREMNLAGPWPRLGEFDLILIRNVLIYFSDEDKARVIRNAASLLRPGGVLMFGASETPQETAGLTMERVGRTTLFRSECTKYLAATG